MTQLPQDRADLADIACRLRDEVVVLDGGLSTELESQGHDVSGTLWSAALLRDDPAAIVTAHRAFLDAGARVVTTASYQATFDGFARAGIPRDEAAALMSASVTLARRAVTEAGLDGGTDGGRDGDAAVDRAWVAASVGPYGAMLADGSEYTGAYADPSREGHLDVAALRAFHRPRLEVLAAAGADVLACETVPCLVEAQALVAELEALAVPAWLSLTTVVDADGRVRTRLGEDAAEAFALARGVDTIVAVGVNCTDPTGVAPAVHVAAHASGKPVVVYPNSGEAWDAAARAWYGEPDFEDDDVEGWIASGARLVGGCCRVGPQQIAQLAATAAVPRPR